MHCCLCTRNEFIGPVYIYTGKVIKRNFFHTWEIGFEFEIIIENLALFFLFADLLHKPADLSERIIFKSKSKTKTIVGEAGNETTKASVAAEEKPGKSDSKTEKFDKKSKKLPKETTSKLSFAFEDDEDEEDA